LKKEEDIIEKDKVIKNIEENRHIPEIFQKFSEIKNLFTITNSTQEWTIFQNLDIELLLQGWEEKNFSAIVEYSPFLKIYQQKKNTGDVENILPSDEPEKTEGEYSLLSDDQNYNIPYQYTSPLLMFKSYRLNPNFPLSLRSISCSHKINPNVMFCRFDLHGVCNDDNCNWQHFRDIKFSDSDLLLDLASFMFIEPGDNEDSKRVIKEKKKKKITFLILYKN